MNKAGDNLFFCKKWVIRDGSGKYRRTPHLIVYQETSRIYLDEYPEQQALRENIPFIFLKNN